jgi:proline iminopeptidase
LPGEGGPDGVVLRDAHRPAGIPDPRSGQLGRQPARHRLAARLHHARPGSELIVVDDVGHDAGASRTTDVPVATTDAYAARRGG